MNDPVSEIGNFVVFYETCDSNNYDVIRSEEFDTKEEAEDYVVSFLGDPTRERIFDRRMPRNVGRPYHCWLYELIPVPISDDLRERIKREEEKNIEFFTTSERFANLAEEQRERALLEKLQKKYKGE